MGKIKQNGLDCFDTAPLTSAICIKWSLAYSLLYKLQKEQTEALSQGFLASIGCLCRFLGAILVSLGKAVNTFIFFHFSDSGLNLLNGINISFIFDNVRVKTSKILSTQMISEICVKN